MCQCIIKYPLMLWSIIIPMKKTHVILLQSVQYFWNYWKKHIFTPGILAITRHEGRRGDRRKTFYFRNLHWIFVSCIGNYLTKKTKVTLYKSVHYLWNYCENTRECHVLICRRPPFWIHWSPGRVRLKRSKFRKMQRSACTLWHWNEMPKVHSQRNWMFLF